MRRTTLIALSAALSVAMIALAGCKKDEAAAGTTGTTGTPGTTGTTGTTGGGAAMSMDAYAAKCKELHDKGQEMGKKMGEEMQAAMGSAGTDPNGMGAALPKVGEVFKKYMGEMEAMVNDMKAVTPPAELAEWHKAKSEQADAGIQGMKDIIGVCEKGDATAFQSAMQKMQSDAQAFVTKSDELLKKAGFNAEKFNTDGTLVKG